MNRQARALRVGAFVIAGGVLLVLAIAFVLGGGLFKRQERALLRFSGSVQGLQIGSPVVFRGVRIGNVVAMTLSREGVGDRPAILVQADLDRAALAALEPTPDAGGSLVAPLVRRGLAARLATQSLLTGQLFVNLDLRPHPGAAGAAAAAAAPVAAGVLAEIPTQPSALEAVQAQFEGVDLGVLVQDLRGVAEAARQFVAGAPLKQTLEEVGRLASEMRRLTARLDRRIGPLADAAERTLAGAARAASGIDGAAGRVGSAADRVGSAATRVDALAAPDAALARAAEAVRASASELGQTATALRGSLGRDAALVTDVDRAAQEVARAARAVRELADLLERHPESLIRGRPANP
jgi:paraquat-inducible protein B